MNRPRQYYFDNNATTQVAPEVVEAMLPFLSEYWGNPSSPYRFGREVARHIEEARGKVASLLNADPSEIVFTSCGTESNNTALEAAIAVDSCKDHVITTQVEHQANLSFCRQLEKRGLAVTYLPVRRDGSIDLDVLVDSIRPTTAIISTMWANNETGAIFPVGDIAAACRSRGILFHTDAVQIPGRMPIDVSAVGVDFLSISAHKFHAPKGVGVLYVKQGTPFRPYIFGGHQEGGRRAGTESVANIVAAGRAAELAVAQVRVNGQRIRALRDRLEEAILTAIPGTSLNGAREPRLPNTTNIAFAGVEAGAMLMLLDQAGICASSGSACTTGSLSPSHVLTAMGLPQELADASLRFSLGAYSSEMDVNYLLTTLPPIVARLRCL